jgi:hypothetical protein
MYICSKGASIFGLALGPQNLRAGPDLDVRTLVPIRTCLRMLPYLEDGTSTLYGKAE